MPNVKMYTTSFCPYCYKAKGILDRKGIEFEEINIQRKSFGMRDEIEKANRSPRCTADLH